MSSDPSTSPVCCAQVSTTAAILPPSVAAAALQRHRPLLPVMTPNYHLRCSGDSDTEPNSSDNDDDIYISSSSGSEEQSGLRRRQRRCRSTGPPAPVPKRRCSTLLDYRGRASVTHEAWIVARALMDHICPKERIVDAAPRSSPSRLLKKKKKEHVGGK